MDRCVAFQTSHPAVGGLCVAAILLLGMFVFQPVYLVTSLVGALCFCLSSLGARATLRKLLWVVPMLVLVCAVNPLFSASGSTELVRVGAMVVYAESLAYGACMGAMLAATILWFEALALVVPSDRMLATAGRVLPTVSLMVSVAAGLVPQLMRKATSTNVTLDACTCANTSLGRRGRVRRTSTMLVSWAMEDSLERSDAMRARGWGATDRRTSYRTYRMRTGDLVALACLTLLAAASALLGSVAASQWTFYPTMPRLIVWWGYVPYAILSLLPTILTMVERVRWHRAGRMADQAKDEAAAGYQNRMHRACTAAACARGGDA